MLWCCFKTKLYEIAFFMLENNLQIIEQHLDFKLLTFVSGSLGNIFICCGSYKRKMYFINLESNVTYQLNNLNTSDCRLFFNIIKATILHLYAILKKEKL